MDHLVVQKCISVAGSSVLPHLSALYSLFHPTPPHCYVSWAFVFINSAPVKLPSLEPFNAIAKLLV